jgi:hypothetical protein
MSGDALVMYYSTFLVCCYYFGLPWNGKSEFCEALEGCPVSQKPLPVSNLFPPDADANPRGTVGGSLLNRLKIPYQWITVSHLLLQLPYFHPSLYDPGMGINPQSPSGIASDIQFTA